MDTGKQSHLGAAWPSVDSRSPSMQSLHSPGNAIAQEKRKLLLVYIHGFLGDETSFKQFPAHVHHCLTEALKERIIHTKVYPKYKTRQKIEQVREIFSEWLAPHETPDQDIILLGHSMGGILAAEVALLPSRDLGNVIRHRHRILGTMHFDVPFLGMHPGIVGSGIGSLFRPAPKPERSPSPARLSTTTSAQSELTESESHADLHPSYSHASSVSQLSHPSTTPSASASASQSSVSLSVPVDDPNYDPRFSNDVILKKRKGRSNFWHFMNKHSNDLLHAAETWVTSHAEFGGAMADYRSLKRRYDAIRALENVRDTSRVRFVNYYTACHGRPKTKKETATPKENESRDSGLDRDIAEMNIEDQEQGAQPSMSGNLISTTEDHGSVEGPASIAPFIDPPDIPSAQRLERLASKTNQSNADPTPEYSRGGREQCDQPDVDRLGSQVEGSKTTEVELESQGGDVDSNSKAVKPKKDKKFCLLPRKHGGVRDPCWIKVFMPNVDEVGAHCGLFSMDEDPDRYELFVQDVSMRLVDWISECSR